MEGITTLFDPELTERVESIWRELDRDFGVRGAVQLTPIPHFSWLVATAFERETLAAELDSVAGTFAPFTVHTSGLGVFTGPSPIVYLPIVRSAALSTVHRALWDRLAPRTHEMNPYYARDSKVGSVFDVATFSPRKAVVMGLTGLAFGALVAAAALYVWNPNWIVPHPPKWFVDANHDAMKLWKEHPLGTPLGVGGAGLVAALFLAMSYTYLFQSLTGNFYFRVGEGGISFHVPGGFRTLELDLPWDEIIKLKVVQEKQLGSLSRNAGNLGGYLTLRTR